MQLIFDEKKIAKQHLSQTSFILYKAICKIFQEDLKDILFIYQLKPATFIDLNPIDGTMKRILEGISINEAENNADIICSFMNLHKMNNIGEYLKKIKNKLNKKGIFVGNFFGISNLSSLGKLLAENDMKCKNFPFQRMLPLIDIKIFGSMLQKAGFSCPVIHSISFEQEFQNLKEALSFLKKEGETNCLKNRDHTLISSLPLKKLLEIFDKHVKLEFDICFFSCLS